MRIPMEVAGGGAMPNGSITFGNKAEKPPETVEPEVVDPFAPENPTCDPLAQDNNPGKYFDFAMDYDQEIVNGVNGVRYRACKLKDTGEPNLLAKFVSVIPNNYLDSTGKLVTSDKCDSSLAGNLLSYSSCNVGSEPYFSYNFKPSKDINGNYSYAIEPVVFGMPTSVSFDNIGKIVIDGVECTNIRKKLLGGWPGNYIYQEGSRICDYPMSYEAVKAKIGKPYITEIYGK